MPTEPHHHHHGDHHVAFDTPESAEFAELEGEMLGELVASAATTIDSLAAERGLAVRRILDVGTGPGVGACLLAERFPAAEIVALDASPVMLERAAARIDRLDLAARVALRRADLPDGLDGAGPADLVWASMVLHHLGDEAAGLRRLAERLAPGGLLALVERAGTVRVSPAASDAAGRGSWDRIDAAWDRWFGHMRAELPGATTSRDYPTMIEQVGLELLTDELVTAVVEPPLSPDARRFARRLIDRTRTMLADHADADAAADLAALDALVDEHPPDGSGVRDDARIVAQRRLYVAAAPR
jgi:SAM-dependent methyltransferase